MASPGSIRQTTSGDSAEAIASRGTDGSALLSDASNQSRPVTSSSLWEGGVTPGG
ncbi:MULTISPECIES: hypothetical protein [Streptomyces violaceusniger group]|uniref:Uncharacterized protein n=2 Tax=Streptomyces rhizosphaericus TaxID=114699 RepID=A0ABN1RY68_9ACTN|nr:MULTISPECIES: hypothetical protein [Streptomyces violaceusniger group]